jgi:hypothetical protein
VEIGFCAGLCGVGGTWHIKLSKAGEIESIENEGFHIH